MADYEEQARALARVHTVCDEGGELYEAAVAAIAAFARRSAELAAEDATRRERERCAALCDEAADDEDKRGNSDAYGMARFCAKRIRGEAARVGVQPATPPPPRPATGEATKCQTGGCDNAATHSDPCDGALVCRAHACSASSLLPVPTPPARTDAEAIGDWEGWSDGQAAAVKIAEACAVEHGRMLAVVEAARAAVRHMAPKKPGECLHCPALIVDSDDKIQHSEFCPYGILRAALAGVDGKGAE